MRIKRHAALFAAFCALSSCGGGGSNSSSAPPVTVTPTPPTTPPTTPPSTPVTSKLTQADARIGACMNLANHLEPPNEGDWGRAYVDSDFQAIADAGFTTLRIPVRWSNHAGTAAPYTIDPAFMARVDNAVTLARAAGLRVILNMHHYEDPQGNIFTDPSAEAARFAAMWRQVADHFRNADDKVWFELLNEPHDQLDHDNLLAILEPALAEVRVNNPERPVVIGGESWSGINSLADLPLPNDPYIVATFHYYDPFDFTHQGAPWITPQQPTGVTFGSASDLDQLARDAQKVRDFQTRTGVPVFLGEYGAYEGIALDQRATYYGAVRDAFHAADTDGCVWGYVNTMPFRQANGDWYEPLLRAIGL